jgi:hypothetical protein
MESNVYNHQNGEKDQAHWLPQDRVRKNGLEVHKDKSRSKDEKERPFHRELWTAFIAMGNWVTPEKGWHDFHDALILSYMPAFAIVRADTVRTDRRKPAQGPVPFRWLPVYTGKDKN